MATLKSSCFPFLVLAAMGLLAILGSDNSVNAMPQPYRRTGNIEVRDASFDVMDTLNKRDPKPDVVGIPQVNMEREEKRDKKHGKKKSGHKQGGHKQGGHKQGGHKSKPKHQKEHKKHGGGKKKNHNHNHKRDDEASLNHSHRPREEYILEDLD